MRHVRKPSGTNGRRRLRVLSWCRRARGRSGGNAVNDAGCGLPPDRSCGFWPLPVLVIGLTRRHGSCEELDTEERLDDLDAALPCNLCNDLSVQGISRDCPMMPRLDNSVALAGR